ncbi:SGNH hydrolase [Byssothecium circinans]|uniref:SGNH hydrolase n=1 Tax=Byssothecium circinans TaxID=147558 RepID=A0A6A5TT61_9PLEO|nr:SGNH hydrolase [Byssothecium circinans]
MQILPEDRSFSVGSALRILPLGDSITWGHGSPDGNGYRYKLLRLLAGNDITYIGSHKSGSMANSNNEGHSGALISDMSLHALKSMHLQPNVILLLAGTNDIYKDVDAATAPARLGSLIDNLITMSPNAAILVAQIPPMNDTSRNAAAQTFNAAIPGIVTSRAGSGAKVLTVERDPRFTTIYLPDGLHPDDLGYGLLAGMFSTGIQRAAEAGWISEPDPLPTANRTACDTFLTWDPKFGTIATGVGSADSAFVSSWQPAGRLATGNVGPPKTWWGADLPQGKWVRLADMDGDGRDDYFADGGVNWINKGEIATGLGEAVGVMFADINGDGRDDYLWISPEGLVTAYINGGEKKGGGWLWTSLGQIAGEGTGATRETTRFADIDGDGKADYMVVGKEGSLNAWLNFGYGDKPDWYPLGIIATGIGDAAGVQLVDLNNDGRADYVWLDKDGAAKAYINNRGGSGGLAPDWINAGSIATGVGAKREELRFADLNGDGKKDYVWVDHASGALDVWFNTATGGSYVVGDGTVFAEYANPLGISLECTNF